jgi:hypothetical protein
MWLRELLGFSRTSRNKCKAISLLESTLVPRFNDGVEIVRYDPRRIDCATEKNGDGDLILDPVIFTDFPTADNPVRLIPATAAGERYDALLMVHRDTGGPLIIAFDFKQSEESFGEEGHEMRAFSARQKAQLEATTDYFDRCKEVLARSGSDSSFDFVYLFVTTKETVANGSPVEILFETSKVSVSTDQI